MPKTDAEHLEDLKTWRDNILAELKTPGTVSAYGGSPDVNGPVQLQRMPGRAQLLEELRWLDEEIAKVEAEVSGVGLFEVTSEMSA